MQDGPLPLTEAEARRLEAALQDRSITAPALGGAAIFLRCPSASRPPLHREYKDIDLVTIKPMVQKLSTSLEELGYQPDKRFNALHGSQRLFFWDEQNSRQLDVFVDRFEMCHTLDLRDRLTVGSDHRTLPLADLLLTKMQIVELNLKDMQDIAALLQDHPFTDNDEGINLTYITELTGRDWGLQHTLERTIARLTEDETRKHLITQDAPYRLADQLATLSKAMDEAPKSTGWKLRARIGERKRWYELPEEARA